MKHAPVPALTLAALLALTSCGTDTEPAEEAEPTEAAESTPESTPEAVDATEDEAGASGDEAEDFEAPTGDEDYDMTEIDEREEGADGLGGSIGGATIDDPISGTWQVGDTFDFYGTDGVSSMDVTWDALEWVTTDDGEDAAIAILSSDNTEGTAPIDQHYPTIDGGGWHYVSEAGEISEIMNMDHSTTFDGVLTEFKGGDGLPAGTTATGEVLWMVTGERGGSFVYMSPFQEFLLVLELPEESTGTEGNESIATINERAADFDGTIIEAW